MARIICPECRDDLELDDVHLGREVRCGRCRAVFSAQSDSPHSSSEPDDRPKTRRPRRRSPEPDDDFDDHPEETLAEALATIRKPALGIFIANAVMGSLMVLALVGFSIFLFAMMPPGAPRGAGLEIVVVFYAIMGFIYIAKMLICMYAARKMMKLQSRSWAWAGAIISVVPFDGLLSVVYIPFGIWAIVTLNRPDVKWAFDYRQRQTT